MGFYDAKGYWRNEGEGFYDAKGYYRNPGDGFYDSKGYFRSAGDGFYDARGNWVSPGGAFYDSKGYLRSSGVVVVANTGTDLVAAVGFILFLPIGLLWMLTTFLVEWITYHLYAVFIGYVLIDVIFCLIVTKTKKHQGTKFALSFLGNYICILSFAYAVLIYAVPYMTIKGGSFGSFFEFTLVLAFEVGGIAVIQFFNYFHGKAIIEFILGILFFAIVIMILKNSLSEIGTIEGFMDVYHLKSSMLFKILFGFAV